jgi:predicted 3-demethylubiquinone-9 3-methyltransferase (glyoxalase superfamily)
MALNGGPQYKFTPAISLFVNCTTQAEVDELWEKISADGTPNRCGWVADKFGVSWQIVPSILSEVLGGKDAAGAKRAFEAMLKMGKLDIAKLKQAYEHA